MTNREFFIQRWEAEYPLMLKVLRALPADKLGYRPHPRSRSAGELVTHLVYHEEARIELCEKGELHYNEPASVVRLDDAIAAYEQHHKALGERLPQLDDAAWTKPAKFWIGGQIVMEDTAGGFLWILLFDDIHHRGQLSAYIRPMGGKVPSIYGPSADDMGT